MPTFKQMVRVASLDIDPTYLEMPEYYKFYNSYNKVISSTCVVSIPEDARNMSVEECITHREHQLAKPITKEKFDEMFNKHLSFIRAIQNNDIEQQPSPQGWEEIENNSRYNPTEYN